MKKNEDVRLPIGSGRFYPSDKGELAFTIGESLETSKRVIPEGSIVKGLILPGLAFEYSLDALGLSYKQLEGQQFDEVFLFGDPVLHRQDKISFSSARAWETPLGYVDTSHRLDRIVNDDDSLKDLMVYDDLKHEGESLLELQLPFLQSLSSDSFRVIPFMIHDVSPRLAAGSLEKFIDSDDLLIAVSHLSGGLPADYTEEIDSITREAIIKLDLETLESESVELSSPSSVGLMVEIAKEKNWKVKELYYSQVEKRRSEDMVIGIASYVFYE